MKGTKAAEVKEVTIPGKRGINLVLPISINGMKIDAVVDTGAQITIISKEFAKQLKPPVVFGNSISLMGAGCGSNIAAKLGNTAIFRIGKTETKWRLLVGDISDNVILDLDLLHHLHAVIDLSEYTIKIGEEKILANRIRVGGKGTSIRRVKLDKRLVIPPKTTVQLQAKLEGSSTEDICIQPVHDLKGAMMPHTVVTGSSMIPVVIKNFTDFISFKKDSTIGTGIEIDKTLDVDNEVPKIREVREAQVDTLSIVPSHLTDLMERSKKHLTQEQCQQLSQFLINYKDTFSKDDMDIGQFTKIQHRIDTGTSPSTKEGLRRTPFGFEKEEEKHLQELLDKNIIQPSTSEWAAAPVICRKKDGKIRYCIDYRKLNAVTRKDAFPLPRIQACIDHLRGTKFMSCLDMSAGYYQFQIHKDDRYKTAFITKYGLFEHVRLSFGLCNSPAFFQRVMQLILTGLTWSQCLAYLDDIIVLGKDFNDHLQNLTAVMERFKENNLKLKPKKCSLFQKEVVYLGKLISEQGISINPENIETIQKWPPPTTKKEVQSFLGYANYHRDHLPNLAAIAYPLHELTKKKTKFEWTDSHQIAFQTIKNAIINSATLTYPYPEEQFILDTDASDSAIAAELVQLHDNKEYIVSYASKVLSPAQKRYCTTRKELLAVVTFTRQFRNYLLGRQFIVRTDHHSLIWLMKFKNLEGQLARWMEELSQYDMVIRHRAGRKHTNADSLSRIPDTIHPCNHYYAGAELESLPCGGCNYCARAYRQWRTFEDEVDDVVPLAIRGVDQHTQQNTDETNINWMEGPSNGEIRQEQESDPDLKTIITWLENDEQPSSLELQLSSAAVKHWWSCKQHLQIVHNCLVYHWNDSIEPKHLLMVLVALRKEALKYCHDNKTAGHMGRDKTYGRLQQRFIWHRMRQDVILYVRSCETCNTNKSANRRSKGALGQYNAGIPMERVHMDSLGPLVESNSGNKYILSMIDQYTKWLEFFPLPNQNAETIAKIAVNNFFSRFGCPLQIHTDQG